MCSRCDCNKVDSGRSNSGIVDYLFAELELPDIDLEDGVHIFLRIIGRSDPQELYIRFIWVDIVQKKLRALNQSDVLADEDYLRDRGSMLFPFTVENLKIQEPTVDEPRLIVEAIVNLDGQERVLTDSVSFEGLMRTAPYSTECFQTEVYCSSNCHCMVRAACCNGNCGPYEDQGACDWINSFWYGCSPSKCVK